MKAIQKLSSLFLILAITTLVSAQTEQGTFLVGGSSGISLGGGSSKDKTDNFEGDPTKYFGFSINPQVGFFVIDNLVIGAILPISVQRSKQNDTKVVFSSIEFAPFARYYFLDDKFRPYATAFFGGGFNGYKYVVNGNTTTNNSNTFLLGLGGGVAYFVNDNIAIDALLGYQFTREKFTDEDDNYRELDHAIGVDIGILVFF